MAFICLHNLLLESEKDILSAARLYQNLEFVDTYEWIMRYKMESGDFKCHNKMIRTGRLGANNPIRAAIIRRDKLRDYFLTEEGEILWQYHHALRNVPIIRQSI